MDSFRQRSDWGALPVVRLLWSILAGRLLHVLTAVSALFFRSDRPETRVRLRGYFHRTQRVAEAEQIDPLLT